MNNIDNLDHYFIDAFSPRRGLIGILAYPNKLIGSDIEYCNFLMWKEGEWGQQSFDFEGRSIVYRSDNNTHAWWVMGKRGEVVCIGKDGLMHEEISFTGSDLGYLNKLALISNNLFACGHSRQVYMRHANVWERFGKGMPLAKLKDRLGLESIDGCALNEIYAVGLEGEIWYFNGDVWKKCTSPTNVDLNEVRVISRNKVCICGQFGTVLIGEKDDWIVIDSNDYKENLWGIDEFEGDIYVSGYGGVAKIDENRLIKVNVSISDEEVEGYRLRSNDGILWSVGNDQILSFDGKEWKQLL